MKSHLYLLSAHLALSDEEVKIYYSRKRGVGDETRISETNPASLCPSLTQSRTCQHPHFAHLPPESSPNQHHSLHSGGLRSTHTLLIEGSRNCLQAPRKMVGLPLKRRDNLLLTVPRSSFKPPLLT